MSTFLEALESFARSSGLMRWALLAARARRIERWKLPRCNAYISDVKSSDNDSYIICNRPKGHPPDVEPGGATSSGCCGHESGCEYHHDVCKCLTPVIVAPLHGRCACGGFPLEATQPGASA